MAGADIYLSSSIILAGADLQSVPFYPQRPTLSIYSQILFHKTLQIFCYHAQAYISILHIFFAIQCGIRIYLLDEDYDSTSF